MNKTELENIAYSTYTAHGSIQNLKAISRSKHLNMERNIYISNSEGQNCPQILNRGKQWLGSNLAPPKEPTRIAAGRTKFLGLQ